MDNETKQMLAMAVAIILGCAFAVGGALLATYLPWPLGVLACVAGVGAYWSVLGFGCLRATRRWGMGAR